MNDGGKERKINEKQRRRLGWGGNGRETEKKKKLGRVQRDRKGEENARKQGGQKNEREVQSKEMDGRVEGMGESRMDEKEGNSGSEIEEKKRDREG